MSLLRMLSYMLEYRMLDFGSRTTDSSRFQDTERGDYLHLAYIQQALNKLASAQHLNAIAMHQVAGTVLEQPRTRARANLRSQMDH